MRSIAFAATLAATLVSAGAASAEVRVETATKYYNVAGKTGGELVRAMDRRGPRTGGLMARAIAQTKYTIGWDFAWERRDDRCKLKTADGVLDITYTYPKIGAGTSPDLKRRWGRFIKGVEVHEKHHGKLARDMVRAAERSVKGLSVRNDPSCRKATAEAKKRIGATYAKFEARQVRFDEVEHSQGGNVYKLLAGLVGRN